MFKNPFKSNDPLLDDLKAGASATEGNEAEENLFDKDVVTSDPGLHFVNPHHVQGYTRSDGTVVDDYWRDGDGDTSDDLTVDEGGGYDQTNPDGDLTNNLG
ncbi:hypothetical protein AABM38_22360 [Heyndrickxia sp. MSNUG]|uniref:hypothetical protein n=1 Tax=Heyndrickxia sp. MSNUG TaxID=3136677 RepID=UPI003C2E052A